MRRKRQPKNKVSLLLTHIYFSRILDKVTNSCSVKANEKNKKTRKTYVG